MRMLLSTLILTPVLLVQERWVKKNIVRLPESLGARTGIIGTAQSLRLFIRSDSAAAGVGVDYRDEATGSHHGTALRAND